MSNAIKNRGLIALLGILMGVVYIYMGLISSVMLIGGIIFLYCTLNCPHRGLFFLIFAIPFVPDQWVIALMGIIFLCYLLNYIKEGVIDCQQGTLQTLLVLFAILVGVTTLFSVNLAGSQRDFILHLSALALLFVMMNTKHTKADMHYIYLAFVGTGVICAIWGLQQYITKVPMGSGWVDPAMNPGVTTRAFAAFENPNLFAMFLLITLPIALSLAYTARNKYSKLVFGLSFGIMYGGLILTLSRGGYLASVIGLMVFIFLTNPKYILGIITLGILSIPLLPSVIINRIISIGSTADSSNAYRLTLWRGAIEIIKDYWPVGTGLGYASFMEVSSKYFIGMAPYHLHNTYLQFFVETGILGIGLFLILIIALIKTALGVVGHTEEPYIKHTTAGLIAGFVSILIHGFFEHLLFNPKIIIYFWMLVGLILMNYKYFKQSRERL